MFGLFTRRPPVVRRQHRTKLRLESLEARANPAAPVLSAVTASWADPGMVVITGKVNDEALSTAVLHVTGATQADVSLGGKDNFMIALKTNGSGPLYLRTTDQEGWASNTVPVQYGDAPPATGGAPSLRDVTIVQDADGRWHIRGRVDNTSPVGTIIKVIDGPGNTPGTSQTVDPDGSFDIVIDVKDGGAISIIAVNGDDGTHSDQWDGLIL